MSRKDYISGPSLKEPIPDCSVAEFFIPLLRSHPKTNIIQVDALTGRAETSLDLLTKSLKISESCRRLGFTPDDLFCLIARNSSDAFAAALAVWWLGGVLAPLDVEWSVHEYATMFGKLKPSAVICEEGVLDRAMDVVKATGRDMKIVVLAERERVKAPHIPFGDLLDSEVDVDSYKPMPVESPSTKLWLVVPTSGSTGVSKGVGLTHRNVIFELLHFREANIEFAFKSVVITSHLYWVSCTCQLMIALATGMKMIYMTEINPKNVLSAIHRYKPEWLVMGPGYFSRLLKEPDIEQCDFSGFKLVELGGSVVTQSIPDLLKKAGKEVPLMNAYGASEVSGVICRGERNENVLAVGKAAVGVKLKIVDPDTGHTLGRNEHGELWVSSPGVMKGYVGDEKETEAAVVGGWFRTGDIAYYDETETFYVVDRLKEMIKDSHDRQVAPSEIEGVIESVPGVQEAGVVALFGEAYGSTLVGLVVKRSGSGVTEEDIKAVVNEKLADYKQLERVIFVEELPRSHAGKLRRRALQEMAASVINVASKG